MNANDCEPVAIEHNGETGMFFPGMGPGTADISLMMLESLDEFQTLLLKITNNNPSVAVAGDIVATAAEEVYGMLDNPVHVPTVERVLGGILMIAGGYAWMAVQFENVLDKMLAELNTEKEILND